MTDPAGALAAQVTQAGTTLELPGLHGDIMATDSTAGSATGPAATYVYNEFGAVQSGSPGAYGWLGGDQISSVALGGQLLMGVRAYNPSTGRFSQVDPVPGGSANPYDYALQNPLTEFDLTGMCSWYCHLLAVSAGGIAGGACELFLPLATWACGGLGSGAYNVVTYIFDSRHPTFQGFVWTFLKGFAAGAVFATTIAGIFAVMGRVAGWLGWSATSAKLWTASRAAFGSHAKLTIWAWVQRFLW